MSTLTDFLLARIAEDEEAIKSRDMSRPIHFVGCYYYDHSLDANLYCDCDEDGSASAHLIAECESKRQLVQLMLNEVKDARRRPGWTLPDSEIDEKGRDYRAGFENAKAQQLPEVLDLTDRLLRLLALPYADHSDYDETWRP